MLRLGGCGAILWVPVMNLACSIEFRFCLGGQLKKNNTYGTAEVFTALSKRRVVEMTMNLNACCIAACLMS